MSDFGGIMTWFIIPIMFWLGIFHIIAGIIGKLSRNNKCRLFILLFIFLVLLPLYLSMSSPISLQGLLPAIENFIGHLKLTPHLTLLTLLFAICVSQSEPKSKPPPESELKPEPETKPEWPET